jgi:hypothetical protein
LIGRSNVLFREQVAFLWNDPPNELYFEYFREKKFGMGNPKLVSVAFDREEIQMLKKLAEMHERIDTSDPSGLLLMPVLLRIEEAFEASLNEAPAKPRSKKDEIDRLNEIIEKQKWQISGLMLQAAMARQLSGFNKLGNTAAAASLIIDPAPIVLRTTRDGSAEEFSVSVRNILAIESDRKKKLLYLREPLRPRSGGAKRHYLEVTSVFDKLLQELNKSFTFFFRVSDKYVINIFDYEQSKQDAFVLQDPPEDKIYDPIRTINVDSKFDHNAYQTLLRDKEHHEQYIDQVRSGIEGAKNLSNKIDELDKYGNSAG